MVHGIRKIVWLKIKVEQIMGKLCTNIYLPKPGVGNSFGFVGHIRDKLGIRVPAHVL